MFKKVVINLAVLAFNKLVTYIWVIRFQQMMNQEKSIKRRLKVPTFAKVRCMKWLHAMKRAPINQ